MRPWTGSYAPLPSASVEAFSTKTVYERGKPVADLNDDLVSTAPEWLRILAAIQAYFNPATDYIWAKNWNYNTLNNPSACVTSDLHNEVYPSRNSTFFQCTTCLTGNPPGIR
jgi:hypothetical protein